MGGAPVIVRIHRGIGNQLFQFAAALSLARRLDAPVRCDNPTGGRLLRVCIGSLWQDPTTRELWQCGTVRHGMFLRQASRLRRALASRRPRVGLPPRRFAPDESRGYDPSFERLTAPCYLYGYFQDRRYWADVIDQLADTVADHLGVAPAPPASPAAEPVLLGIHLRRGDYVEHGWVLDQSYHHAALALALEQVPEPTIRVIGDEPDAVRAFAAELADLGHRVEPEDPRPRHDDSSLSDLIRVAECDHLIISNSSFAWWGAALGDRRHAGRRRVVVMPDVWLGGESSRQLQRPGWQVATATTSGIGVLPGREQSDPTPGSR